MKDEEASLALKMEEEQAENNISAENEEETEEQLAEKAAAEEAKRVRRLEMIAERDMIPRVHGKPYTPKAKMGSRPDNP